MIVDVPAINDQDNSTGSPEQVKRVVSDAGAAALSAIEEEEKEIQQQQSPS